MEKKADNKFMFEASDIENLKQQHNVTSVASLLPILAATAQSLARPPISSFPVGVAAVGISGRIYLGCNVEFPKLPLHHSIHAEQFLITNALLHSEPQLLSLAVTAAPCGHCRQFLQELRNASQIQIQVISDPLPTYRPLIHLLPRPFTPLDLLTPDSPLLLETQLNRKLVVDFDSTSDDIEKQLLKAATEAAREAYAPYSKCPSGFAVMDGDGKVCRGSYMESAAYNPSVGPVQAAMVGYLVGGGTEWDRIVGGVLVEGVKARVSQEGTVRVFFEKVAPEAKIWVHRFEIDEEE